MGPTVGVGTVACVTITVRVKACMAAAIASHAWLTDALLAMFDAKAAASAAPTEAAPATAVTTPGKAPKNPTGGAVQNASRAAAMTGAVGAGCAAKPPARVVAIVALAALRLSGDPPMGEMAAPAYVA